MFGIMEGQEVIMTAINKFYFNSDNNNDSFIVDKNINDATSAITLLLPRTIPQ